MAVFDCFTFFNEHELLAIRFHELADVVDYHVIVDATTTFTGRPRRLGYDPLDPRWARFRHKVVHVVVDDTPQEADPWDKEAFQRNAILRGLDRPPPGGVAPLCGPQDLVLIGDADEIPSAVAVRSVARRLARGTVAFRQGFFYYRLNQLVHRPGEQGPDGAPVPIPWIGTVAVRRCELSQPQALREAARGGRAPTGRVVDGGWHFSYLGGAERVRLKLASFSHQELNTPDFTDPGHIAAAIERGEDLFRRPDHACSAVPVDERFPRYVREHQAMLADLIAPVAPPSDGPASAAARKPGAAAAEAGPAPAPDGPRLPSTLRELFGTDAAYAGFPRDEFPPGFSAIWSLRPVMDRLVGEVRPRRIIEVGSWEGASAIHFALACQREGVDCAEILCVDTWLGSPELVVERRTDEGIVPSPHFAALRYRWGFPQVYYTFLSNVVAAGVQLLITPVPLTSDAARRVFETVGVTADLIYIDGAHDYDSVLRDLLGYWDLLEPRGVLLGDDLDHPPIRAAAEAFARERDLAFAVEDGKFIFRKPSASFADDPSASASALGPAGPPIGTADRPRPRPSLP